MVDRNEYDPLRGEPLREFALEASDSIEQLVELGNGLKTMHSELMIDSESMLREARFDSIEYAALSENFLMFDGSVNGVVSYHAKGSMYEKKVIVMHQQLRSGPKVDTYHVSFERTLPYTTGAFKTAFTFEFFAGGSIQATVSSNNIDVDDETTGAYYERPVAAYDIRVFQREMHDALQHAEAGQKERTIDQQLAN